MITKQPTSLTEMNTFLSRWNRFVSVLIVALYNTLSLYKLLYISQSFSRPFCLFHSRTKQVSFLKTPQSLRPGQYQSSPGLPIPGIGHSKYCIPQPF